MLLQNQGLLGIAFFEATASLILLVLFLLFRRDHRRSISVFGCRVVLLYLFSLCEVAQLIRPLPDCI